MWIVTLIAKQDSLIEDKITFEFETVIEVTSFIEKAVKSSVGKVEVSIKFEDGKREDADNE